MSFRASLLHDHHHLPLLSWKLPLFSLTDIIGTRNCKNPRLASITSVHVKLTHDRWPGPWTVTAAITPGPCYHVTLQGRRERVRRAAASHIKLYHLRPPPLRHNFGDEYAHFAWGLHLGLAAASALVSSMYTVGDRCPIQLPNRSWE